MKTMTYEQAKEYHSNHKDAIIYVSRYDGSVWSSGRMIEVGDIIGYHLTEQDAKASCEDYELHDFDKSNLHTSVEVFNDFEE